MHKHKILLFTLFLVICLPTLSAVVGGESPTSPFPPTFSLASEEENTDSFNCHPENRWYHFHNEGTTSAEDGQLNINHVGDGSDEQESWSRGLQSLDDSIRVQFKADVNKTTSLVDDQIYFLLADSISLGEYLFIRFCKPEDGGEWNQTDIVYKDIDGVVRTYSCDAYISDGIWYTLRIDYNLLESKLRFRLYFENNSEIFDYDESDIFTTYSPGLFATESLIFRFGIRVETSTLYMEKLLEFVEAPFKEREWVQRTTPSDSDFLQDGWSLAEAQDDINDYSEWDLITPYLDSVSGAMTIECETSGNLVANDKASVQFEVYAVDANDGDLHAAVSVRTEIIHTAGSVQTFAIAHLNGSTIFQKYVVGSTSPRITFTISTRQDRSYIALNARWLPDRTDEDTYYDIVGEMAIADIANSPSSEFLCQTTYLMDFDGDTELRGMVEGIDVATRERLTDYYAPLDPDSPGNRAGGWNPFQWLGDTIKGALTLLAETLKPFFEAIATSINIVLGTVQTALETAIGLVETAIGLVEVAITTMQTALETAIGLVETAIGNIEGWLSTVQAAIVGVIEDIQTWLADTATAIGDYLLGLIGDFIDAAITWVGGIITDLLELGWSIWYGLWEAIGLEGIFDVGDALFTGFLQLITGLPTFIIDMANFFAGISNLLIVLGFFWIFILPIAMGDNVGEFLEHLGHQAAFDCTFGLDVLGFGIEVPIFLPWLSVTIFTFMTGTFFFGFF